MGEEGMQGGREEEEEEVEAENRGVDEEEGEGEEEQVVSKRKVSSIGVSVKKGGGDVVRVLNRQAKGKNREEVVSRKVWRKVGCWVEKEGLKVHVDTLRK